MGQKKTQYIYYFSVPITFREHTKTFLCMCIMQFDLGGMVWTGVNNALALLLLTYVKRKLNKPFFLFQVST